MRVNDPQLANFEPRDSRKFNGQLRRAACSKRPDLFPGPTSAPRSRPWASPPRPHRSPRLDDGRAARARRALRDRRGRHPLQGPHRCPAGRRSTPGTRSPASHAIEDALGAGDWCRKALRDGQGAGAGRQFRQRQRLHRQEGPEAVELTVEAAAKAVGCGADEVFVASTGVIGEPLDAGNSRIWSAALAGRRKAHDDWRRRGARDHDHRHLIRSWRRATAKIDGVEVGSTASAKAPA